MCHMSYGRHRAVATSVHVLMTARLTEPAASVPDGRTTAIGSNSVGPLGPLPHAGSLTPTPKLIPARAAAGALLITLAALGVFIGWSRATSPPTTTYVVAARAVAPGQVLASGDLVAQPMELSDAVAGGAFTDGTMLVGAVAVAPLEAGDLIQRSAVVQPEGDRSRAAVDALQRRQVSLSLDRSRAVAGLLEAGESVDILATYGSGTDAWTEKIASDAVVIGVGDSSDSGLTSAGTVVVTVALHDDLAVLRAVNATDAGVLTLVRSTGTGAGSGADAPAVVAPIPPEGRSLPRTGEPITESAPDPTVGGAEARTGGPAS